MIASIAVASIAVASVAIGIASWAAFQYGKWDERQLAAERYRANTRAAQDAAIDANLTRLAATIAARPDREDSTLLMFDGENVRQVSYSGPALNSYKGGVA